MVTITIPHKISKKEDLIAISRKEYAILLAAFRILKEKKQISENDILRWSKEARMLKKTGKLAVLRSLKELR